MIDRILRNSFANWDHVLNGSPCWDWLGKKNAKGYPQLTMRVPGKKTPQNVYVHRLSLQLFKGVDPGEVAMHLCDRPCCINPDHLQPGTHKENYDDAVAKGRHINAVKFEIDPVDFEF